MQENENKINLVINTALKNLNALTDVNTVIGKPLRTDEGDYIFPVSKLTFGYMTGGGEYGKVNFFKKESDLPFSAGSGAVVSVKPSGFLIKDKKGYKVLSVSGQPYDKIIDKATEFFEQIQSEQIQKENGNEKDS